MGKKTVSVIIEGGKATAAPPVGSTLGPLGVNVANVVAEMNKRTAELKGMQVPVKITIDDKTKEFSLEIGTPSVAALITKELGLKKGSGKAGVEMVGNITLDQAKKIARTKFESDGKSFVNQIIGTARSMGVGFKD